MTTRPVFNGSTVLVAEDSTVVRAVLRQNLVEHGYRVLEADDGVAALRMAQEHSPDVVLLDIRMPDHDGLEALEKIHKEVPDTRVVMLSTYDNPTYVARAVPRTRMRLAITREQYRHAVAGG